MGQLSDNRLINLPALRLGRMLGEKMDFTLAYPPVLGSILMGLISPLVSVRNQTNGGCSERANTLIAFLPRRFPFRGAY